jgi:AcrR family transcriptional regulator
MTEHPDTTRQKLFEAAVEVFARKGHSQATVREICALAGANVAAVNYHFGGKEALYAEVLNSVFCDAGFDLDALADASVPAEKRLEKYIRDFCSIYYCMNGEHGDGSHVGSVYLMEMANPSEALDGVVERYIRPEADMLGAILRQLLWPGVPDHLVTACAQLVVSQILSGLTLWPIISRLRPEASPVQERLDQTVALITRFSLGGIQAVRETFNQDQQPEPPHG